MTAADPLLRPRLRRLWRNYTNPKAVHRLAGCLLLAVLLFTSACGTTTPTQMPSGSSVPTPNESPASTTTSRSSQITSTPRLTATPPSSFSIKDEDLNGQVVQFWYVLPERIKLAGVDDPIAAAVVRFNNSNPYDIRVEAVSHTNEEILYSQLDASMHGDLPSLVALSNAQLARLDSTARLVVDLEPYVGDSLWGFTPDEQAGFLPVFWNQDIFSGKRLGIPFYRNVQVLYYNSTWAEVLGYEAVPRTVESFKEQACAAAGANTDDDIPENNRTGGWLVSTGVEAAASWLFAFETRIEDQSGGGYQLDQIKALQAFAYLRGLYAGGCSWVDNNRTPADEFANRRALMISGSLTAIPDIDAALQRLGSQDEWTVLPYPGNSGGTAVDAYGPALGVLKSNNFEQMAAWLFARYLLAPEVQASLVESMGILPVSLTALDELPEYRRAHPQWDEAAALLDSVHTEPPSLSWPMARWALHDAMVEIYRPSFTDDKLSDLVELLSDTLEELEDQ